MNKVILMGRLTKAPEIKYLQDDNKTAMARYTLAVDRRYGKDREREADFISCVTFEKNAEFAEIYLKKGTKIVISGRICTGSYTDSEGVKRYRMGAFALCFMLLVMCTRVPELKTSDITKIENVVSEVCYCIESKRLIFGRVEEKAPATLQ